MKKLRVHVELEDVGKFQISFANGAGITTERNQWEWDFSTNVDASVTPEDIAKAMSDMQQRLAPIEVRADP